MAVRSQAGLRLHTVMLLGTLSFACAMVSACAVSAPAGPTPAAGPPIPENSVPAPTTSPIGEPPLPKTGSPTPSSAPSTTRPPAARVRVLASDGKPRASRLTIPMLDIKDLRVRPHRGAPDDAMGTRIQNGGIAASPHGPRGGVGPGGIGNHLITAHRLSSTQAFLHLPKLRPGAKVHLVAGGQRYTYRITRTRTTSFRSKKSLAAQAAPVPGRPGVRATAAMITLSTCRTPEDHAEGNFWSDEFGNPEHRIDKIGVLVAIRPA